MSADTRVAAAIPAYTLRAVWPAAPPPLVAPKAIPGEHGGGYLAAALLAAAGAPVVAEGDPLAHGRESSSWP